MTHQRLIVTTGLPHRKNPCPRKNPFPDLNRSRTSSWACRLLAALGVPLLVELLTRGEELPACPLVLVQERRLVQSLLERAGEALEDLVDGVGC